LLLNLLPAGNYIKRGNKSQGAPRKKIQPFFTEFQKTERFSAGKSWNVSIWAHRVLSFHDIVKFWLFRNVRTDLGSDLGSDLTTESTEKKDEKGSERALRRNSRKNRKDAKDLKYF